MGCHYFVFFLVSYSLLRVALSTPAWLYQEINIESAYSIHSHRIYMYPNDC